MKSTLHPAGPPLARLVCTRCGLVAQPGTTGWRALTAVSHAGPTLAAERAGHEVALDLCRRCLRDVLRSVLGAPGDSDPSVQAGSHANGPQVGALRSMNDAEAFIRASNARLAAWRRADEECAGSDCGSGNA